VAERLCEPLAPRLPFHVIQADASARFVRTLTFEDRVFGSPGPAEINLEAFTVAKSVIWKRSVRLSPGLGHGSLAHACPPPTAARAA
jgi:hypothetical protein